MGIGTSIVLIAVGAILKYAVTASVSGIDIQTVGVILMVAGIVGLVLSLLWTAMARRRGVVVDDVPRRGVLVDDRPRRF
ncbi:MAG TPA: DUF6458 family protein [Thermoleophilaceae bacterium]|jgi:hypothetical protein